MQPYRSRLPRVLFLLMLLVGAMAVVLSLTDRAEAQVDISGDWSFSIAGAISGTCRSAIFQTGSDLFAPTTCSVVGSGDLEGSIDPDTRAVSLAGALGGIDVSLEGVVSEDGNSMEGVWTAFVVFTGTFTGTRTSTVPALIDLTGDWDIGLYGGLSEACSASFDQSLNELSIAMECPGLGSGQQTGTIDVIGGRFFVEGLVGDERLSLEGAVDEAGQFIQGFWFNEDGSLWGGFLGAPAGELDSGVLAVACDSDVAPVPAECAYTTGASFQVEILVILPPREGYAGFQAQLHWTEGNVNYLPTLDPADEALWPGCAIPARVDNRPADPSIVFSCSPPKGEPDPFFTGAILTLEFECKSSGDGDGLSAPIGLSGPPRLELVSRTSDPEFGTQLLDQLGSPVDPLLLNATVFCFEPRSELPGGDGEQFAGLGPGAPDETPADSDVLAESMEPDGSEVLAEVTLPQTGAARPFPNARFPVAGLTALVGAMLLLGFWRLSLQPRG